MNLYRHYCNSNCFEFFLIHLSICCTVYCNILCLDGDPPDVQHQGEADLRGDKGGQESNKL